MQYRQNRLSPTELRFHSEQLIRSHHIQVLITCIDYIAPPIVQLLSSVSPYYNSYCSLCSRIDWHLLFDELFSSSSNQFDAFICSCINVSHPNISHPCYLRFISNIKACNIDHLDISFLYSIIRILSNPVGFNHSLILFSKRVLSDIASLAPFYTPFIANAIYRSLYTLSRHGCIHRLSLIISRAERYALYNTIDTVNLLYAFGHQVVYPRFFHAYNKVFNTQYRLIVDPRSVANPSLLKLQLKANFPIHLIDTNTFSPINYRLWPISLSIPNYREQLSSFGFIPQPYSHPEYSIDTLLNTSKLSSVSSSIVLSSPETTEVSPLICDFISSYPNFIVASWRTNHFKQESTNFNLHRNSDEMSVLNALDKFSRITNIPIIILCDISFKATKFVHDSSFITELLPFSEISHSDYLFLLSRAICCFSGPSGSCYSGAFLFNKPSLIFDSLPFNSFLYHPLCAHLFKHWNYKNQSNHNFDYTFLRDSIPHDHESLSSIGFTYSNLSTLELVDAFSYFYNNLLRFPDLSCLNNSHYYDHYKVKLSRYPSSNGFY